MKKSMTSLWLGLHLLAVPCCFVQMAYAQETLTPEQIEEVADRRVTAEVLKLLDLRKIAGELEYDWPVTPPAYSFADHLDRARKMAMQLALEKYPDTLLLTAKLEAETKFSLLKVGDDVEIRSAKPPHSIYKGRIQAITETAVRIGNSGMIYVQDLDEDTYARFSEERSENRKEQYVRQRTAQVEASRTTMIEEMMPDILERELLADGYIPVNDDKKKPKLYFAQSNWVDKSATLEARAQEKKKELYDERIKSELENLYAFFGYQFDQMTGRWRLVNHVHDFPLTGSKDLKRSFMEKLLGK